MTNDGPPVLTAPEIYAPPPEPLRAPANVRLAALAIAAGCLAVLLLAAWLRPSPTGHSSHTGLGLDRCQFLARTGLPCPSCGMTTSFTWFARGNVAASLYVQPMGTAVAALAAVSVWVGFYIALTGRPVYRLMRLFPGKYYFGPLFVLAILAWVWKMVIHAKGIDGWR